MRVLRSINAKPCCGEVQPLGPITLDPGQSATLKVQIRVGEKLGPLDHLAFIETDHPSAPRLAFRTLTTVYPRVRIEEIQGTRIKLLPGQEAELNFVVHSYGTPDERPAALSDNCIQTSLPLIWKGPATEHVLADGIVEISRHFAVTIQAEAEPIHRTRWIQVLDGTTKLLEFPLNWEVVSGIEAVPAALVIDSSKTDYRVLLKSQDGRPFRITRTQTDIPGIKVDSTDEGAARLHSIRLSLDPKFPTSHRNGEARITTDHPSQANVKVLLLFRPNSG